MWTDLVGNDLFGFPYNKKYPPNKENKAFPYNGYATPNREIFFYSFAVQGYDVEYTYNGKKYYVMFEPDAVYESDNHFTAKLKKFQDGNDYIENYLIDGIRLIDIIDELEDVEPM